MQDVKVEVVDFEVGDAGRGGPAVPQAAGPPARSGNARRLLALAVVAVVACTLVFAAQLLFSFNTETYSLYTRGVPYFHPRYFLEFLNWAFNLHLTVEPYLEGQRLDDVFQYGQLFLSVVTMVAAASGLAAAGATYQAVFNNPLASPDLLGVSAATEFGGVFAFVVLLFGYYGSFTVGMLLGFATIALVFLFGNLIDDGHPRVITLLLTGVVLTQLYNSLITLVTSGVLTYTAGDQDSEGMYEKLLVFLQAHFDGSLNWFLLIVVVAGIVALVFLAWRLNALSFGDEEARGMGLNPRRIRTAGIGVATALTAVVVSQCGPLGFVGLVAPHIARRIVGQDYRWVIPASMLVGCAFVALACLVCQFIGDTDVNSITTIIGVPYFIKILLDMRRRRVHA